MRIPCKEAALFAVIAVASGTAAAQAGLSPESAGLGLKPMARVAGPADRFENEIVQWRRLARDSDFALYGGARETPRLGLRANESFAGIVYSASGGWASSLEAGYIPASALTPRGYALTGQLQTSLSEGKTLSVGLKYRGNDTESALRYGMPAEVFGPNWYSLTAPQLAGFGNGASGYQVLMSYHYSPAGTVGLALGREVETATFLTDYSASGPRQFSFTGQHWLTPSWALSYDVLSPDLATPLRLEGLRLGVRYRF